MEKNKKVLWLPQHTPTPEQLKELEERGTIEYLKEISPKLFGKLANSPSSLKELSDLADELYTLCQKYYTVVLPIGSPAFNFLFASMYNTLGEAKMAGYHRNFVCAFAHTERLSVDNPDGTKTIKFKYEKFIYC